MPIFEVEHQGQVYEVDAPDINAAASAFDPAPAAAPDPRSPFPNEPGETGASEAGLSAITGALANIPAGVAGAARAAGGLLAAPFSDSTWSDALQAGGETVDNVRNKLTFQPGTEEGRTTQEALGKAAEPINAVLKAPGNLMMQGAEASGLVSPEVAALPAAAAETILNVVAPSKMMGLDKGARAIMADSRTAAAGKQAVKTQPKAPPSVQKLREQGFTARPSDVQAVQPGKKTPGQFREALAGSEAVRGDFGTKNAALSTRLAGEDIGLKNAERITQADIDAAVKPHKETYHATARSAGKWKASNALQKDLNKITADKTMDVKLRRKVAAYVDQFRNPNLSGSDVVGTISDLRARARKNMKDTATPETQEMGWAARRIADALEQELESQLMSVGGQVSAKQFRDARQALAKIHDVEGSLKADIPDTHYFKKLRDRGVPLSGNLATLADAAEYLPEVNRHPQTLVRPGIGAASAAAADTSLLGALRYGATSGLRKHLGGEGFQSKFGKGPGPQAEPPVTPPGGPMPPAPKRPTLSLPAPGGTSARNQGIVPGETQLAGEMGLTGGELARRNMGLSPGQLNAAPKHPAYANEQEFPTGGLSLAPDGPLPADRVAVPGEFDTGGLSLADEMSLNNGEPLPPNLAEFDTEGLSLVGDLLALPNPGNAAPRPRQGFSGGTQLADDLGIGTARERETMGLSPDIVRAGQRHPGRAREPMGQPVQQQQAKAPSLSDDLGLSVAPNPTEPGYFDIVDAQGRVQATVEGEAQARALLGDELIEPGPATAAAQQPHTPQKLSKPKPDVPDARGKIRGPR